MRGTGAAQWNRERLTGIALRQYRFNVHMHVHTLDGKDVNVNVNVNKCVHCVRGHRITAVD